MSHDDVLEGSCEGLRDSAASLRRLARHMADTSDDLNARCLTHRQTWTGSPADAFFYSFGLWRGDLHAQVTAAGMMADCLDEVADDLANTSDRVAALWGGRPAGGDL